MAIQTVARAAVAVSVAGALSLTGKANVEYMQQTGTAWSTKSVDLPRAALQSVNMSADGCGKDVPGYFGIDGLMWAASWRLSKVWSATECAQICDDNSHCIAFSTQRGHGKLQCALYKGLLKKPDHYAMSYMKCIQGLELCKDGFQFSHSGSWREGLPIERLDDEDIEECQKTCKASRACVAFTHRVDRVENKFCIHYEDPDNKMGPGRDSKAVTYSKCVLEGSLADNSTEEDSSTEEDNSTAEDHAPADDQSHVVEDNSPVEAPASADEQSQASKDEDAL